MTVQELDVALIIAEEPVFCVKQEIIYYKLTHPVEFKQDPSRFRIQKVSFEEKLENLRSILGEEEIQETARNSAGRLPTDDDLIKLLSDDLNDEVPDELNIVNDHTRYLNFLVVVSWFVNDVKTWYLGYVNEILADGDRYVVEHLQRVNRSDQF